MTGKKARSSLRRGAIVLAVLLYFCAAGAWSYRTWVGKNQHTVIPGKVYRSAQLNPKDLEALCRRYGIRTIINLRGCCPSMPWYVEQCRVAQRLGINTEDIGFSAYRFPHAAELRELVDVLDNAEYPIYLHCRRGCDRTGLACATLLLLQPGTTLAEARRQLSLRYGHLAIGRAAYLGQSLKEYGDWLQERPHSPARFRRWVQDEYRGGWHHCTFANFVHGELRAGKHIPCEVEAHNTGPRTWRFQPVAAAGMHLNVWVRNDKDSLVASTQAALLEAVVPPGELIQLHFVLPPLPAGRYQLFATLEDAANYQLYQTGSEPLEVEIEICDEHGRVDRYPDQGRAR